MAFSTDNIGKNCYINMSEDENVEDSLYGTIIGYYKDTDKNEEYYFVSINGNVKRIYDDSLVNIVDDGGGGSGAVSSVNGKTGAVVLNAEDVGAEPEKFVITVTYDDVNGEYTADKTFAEIQEAYAAGKMLVVYSYDYSGYFYLTSNDLGVGATEARFEIINYMEEIPAFANCRCFYVDNTDGWSYYEGIIDFRPVTFTISGTTPTITPEDNTIYNCGELASLTISNPPATGKYAIIFYSGATATTTVGIENFAAEANKRYKITVEDNYATYDSWATT